MKLKKLFIDKWSEVTGKLVKLAGQGLSKQKLTLCIAMGICFSIFPVMGVTTVMCAIAAFVFRLNLPLIQLVNYAVYPLQLVLLIPFLTVGSWLFGRPLSIDAGRQLLDSMQKDLWGSLIQIWDLILYAIGAWILIIPIVAVLLYVLLSPVVARILSAVEKAQTARTLTNETR